MKKKKKKNLTEDEIIELIKPLVEDPSGRMKVHIGDDTAVIASPPPGVDSLVTTDLLVEGTHFNLEWSSPYQVGWKAMVASVSDIASMGGRPVYAVISGGIRAAGRENFSRHLFEGIVAAAKEYDVVIAGGDTVRSKQCVINVAMFGEVAKDRAITRKGAHPGDVLMVTDTCGDSAAGLAVLLEKGKKELTHTEADLVNVHLAPRTSVAAGIAAAASGMVTAMMDLSDGIATDAKRLAQRSGVGLSVSLDHIPLSRGLIRYCKKNECDPLQYAFGGGEDFNLMMAVQPEGVELLGVMMAEAGVPLTAIGEVTGTKNVCKVISGGQEHEWPQVGFSHFG